MCRHDLLVVLLIATHSTHAYIQPAAHTIGPRLLRPRYTGIRASVPYTPSGEVQFAKVPPTTTPSDASESPKRMSTIDAVSIIAGTAIGGGFLALPAVTAPLGYLPSAFGLLSVWAFLSLTAVTFVEACGYAVEEAEAEGSPVAVSHASIISRAFGPRLAFVGGCAFCAQMVAVLTAQVVKGGEFIALVTSAPYTLACILPTVLVGLFTFACDPTVVERANTALAAAMLVGFAALVAGAVTLGGGPAAAAGAGVAAGAAGAGGRAMPWLTRGAWGRLLPLGPAADTWAVPVFLNLLCFTQSVPLIVQRLLVDDDRTSRSTDEPPHETVSDAAAETADVEAARWRALSKARMAILGGSAVPLALSLIWAAVATALVPVAAAAGSTGDPLFCLLSLGAGIAVPVGTLAIGAIGTTLLSSFLAMGHFASELLCATFGYCSVDQMNVVRVLTVTVPCILACAGPSLYLPLLAFSGAYPTTLLYCLSPPLAAMTLRRRAYKRRAAAMREAAQAESSEAGAMVAAQAPPLPRPLLPGGRGVLGGLVVVALAVLASSSWIAARQLLGAIARL